jgi:hypothetical protein
VVDFESVANEEKMQFLNKDFADQIRRMQQESESKEAELRYIYGDVS